MATAWRLFYRDGYRAVGIDTLLAEAGVAKMTLYNHFASKEELIIAILAQRDQDFRDSIAARVGAAGPDPVKQLEAVFVWLEDWFAEKNFRGCAFIRALAEYPEPTHPIHQTARRHKTAVQADLAALCAAAGAKQPDALAKTLGILIDGAIVAAHATHDTAPARTARAAAMSLLRLAQA